MMKPVLKWAGSKYKIIDKIKAVLPEGERLIEPFVGSGAVFLNTDYREYLLADINSDYCKKIDKKQDLKFLFFYFRETFFLKNV